MKKLLTLALAAVLAFGLFACGTTNDSSSVDFDDGTPIEDLRGNERVVRILCDDSLNIGAGYSDVVLKNRSAILSKSDSGDVGKTSYRFTKAVHNYNVVNNGIRLNYLDWGWDYELTQKLTNAFMSGGKGESPEVILGESQMIGYMEQGLLKPFPDELAAFVREKMLPATYKALEKDGKIYGVAANPSCLQLIYNKAVLRACGVSETVIENGVSTWDEFISVCQTVKANGKGRYYAGGIYSGSSTGGYMRIAPFMIQAGGGYTDADGKPYFDSEGNVRALEMLRQIGACNPTGGLSSSSEATMINQFTRGRYAFMVDGSWRVKMSNETGLDVGYCKLPSPDGKTDVTLAVGLGYLAVPNYVSDPTDAFAVIKSYISDEAQSVLADADLRPVARLDIGSTEDYKDRAPTQYEAFNILKNSQLYILPSFGTNEAKIWQAFGEALVKTTTTNESISSLLTAAQQAVQGVS